MYEFIPVLYTLKKQSQQNVAYGILISCGLPGQGVKVEANE